jgi:predicted RNA binding protein YcfA (HicA-like mRNA interferase family)
MKIRDVIKLLEGDGWRQERQRGSHRIFRHPHKPGSVTVAGKPSADLPPGTLGSIRRQAGLKDKAETQKPTRKNLPHA